MVSLDECSPPGATREQNPAYRAAPTAFHPPEEGQFHRGSGRLPRTSPDRFGLEPHENIAKSRATRQLNGRSVLVLSLAYALISSCSQETRRDLFVSPASRARESFAARCAGWCRSAGLGLFEVEYQEHWSDSTGDRCHCRPGSADGGAP